MQFKDVTGQDKIKEQLIRSVSDNRVSHAQLFLGPEGCGNLAMALAYAQYIDCENRSENDSCGICPSCSKSQKFIHPDIHFTFPFVNIEKRELCSDWLKDWRQFLSNSAYGNYNDWIKQIEGENKQGNINAKECGDILRKLSLTTFESKYKILILWLPEFLDKEGNRLLKIIEEPPDNTVFIMVANNSERIMHTILSRLQIIKFGRLSEDDIAETLSKKYEIDAEQSKMIASVSDGNLNEALKKTTLDENENAVLLSEWIDVCSRGNVKDIFAWNEKFAKLGREYQKNYFQHGLYFFREILLTGLGAGQLTQLTAADLKAAGSAIRAFTPDKIGNCIRLLDKCIFFVERNANAKILITYASVELMNQFSKNSGAIKKPFFAEWEM